MTKNTEADRGSVAVSGELWRKLRTISSRIPGTTPTSIGQACIEAILEMSETPEPVRRVPEIVKVLDAVNESSPKLLKSAKESTK